MIRLARHNRGSRVAAFPERIARIEAQATLELLRRLGSRIVALHALHEHGPNLRFEEIVARAVVGTGRGAESESHKCGQCVSFHTSCFRRWDFAAIPAVGRRECGRHE